MSRGPAAAGGDVVFQTGVGHQQVPGGEPVLPAGRADLDVAVQHLEGKRFGGSVGRDVAAGPQHHQSDPQRSLLQQRPGVPAMAFQQGGVVDDLALFRQVQTDDVSREGTIDG